MSVVLIDQIRGIQFSGRGFLCMVRVLNKCSSNLRVEDFYVWHAF